MELTESQFQRIADCLPRQRGNVGITNLQLLNALLYVVEHGCKWRGLPKHFGNWHTIYTRMNRLEQGRGLGPGIRPAAKRSKSWPSTSPTCAWIAPPSKSTPTAPGRYEKRPPGHWPLSGRDAPPQIHLVAANDRCALMLKIVARSGGGRASRTMNCWKLAVQHRQIACCSWTVPTKVMKP